MAVIGSNTPRFFMPEEVSDFERHLATGEDGPYFVVEEAGPGIVACGGYCLDLEASRAWLTWGMVHRTRHRQGLGTLLLRERLRGIAAELPAGEVLLDTSQRSRSFFERFGFEVVKITPEGYGPALDRVDMRLALGR